MTPVSSATSTSAATSGTATSRSTLASNFDQFLQLLTTQLKNQSPLDPLDTNQFTQQLVQFSGVEQQLKTNDLLANMITGSRVAAATGAVSFIGQRVVADGTASSLKGGKAEWNLDFPRGASNVKIEIKSKTGDVVYSESKNYSAGAQKFTWNGKTSIGTDAANGEYSIVVTAKDGNGAQMNVTTQMSGIVDGVDFSTDTPILRVGSLSVPIANVKSISKVEEEKPSSLLP
jgi:flagellar basal-body rod modification protein FlgD